MKTTLGELKRVIRNCIAGSHPSEAYDKLLDDDPTFAKDSVLVPYDIKDAINKWSAAMGLSSKKRRRRTH